MKSELVFVSMVLVIIVMGCAAPAVPTLTLPPDPPSEWEVSTGSITECHDITGEYELVPMVAILEKNGAWHISTGNWFDNVLLFPFDRVDINSWTSTESSHRYSNTSITIELFSQEDAIRIVSPVKNSDEFVAHTFRMAKGDYTCNSGRLVFPEFGIIGGTEGSALNGRKYRHVTITNAGDLLFYAQIQGEAAIHKYYFFPKK
jgi:hypothetical protein